MSAPDPDAQRPGNASRLHTQLFGVLWAIATLFHLIAVGDQAEELSSAVLWCTAVIVIAFPRWPWSLALLATAQLYECVGNMPWVSNHWMTTSWVNLLVVGSIGLAWQHARHSPPSKPGEPKDPGGHRWPEYFFLYLRGPLLALVGVLYFYAVFHKLNYDFFDPDYSCATRLYSKLQDHVLPVLPEGPVVSTLCIVGTLVVEALIPILIALPKTRRVGVVFGIAFHTMLASIPSPRYYNFSAMLIALFVACLDSRDVQNLFLRAQSRWHSWSSRSSRLRHTKISPRVLSATVVVIGFWIWGRSHIEAVQDHYADTARYLFFVYGSFIATAVASLGLRPPLTEAAHSAAPPQNDRPSSMAAGLRWTIPLAFFLNAASPYLGLKTELSLSMYSNLKTENHESNHAIIQRPLDIFGWQNDIVTFEDSSSKRLQRYRKKQRGWPWVEFRDYLARYPKYRVQYRRGGETFTVEAKVRGAKIAKRMPWWQRKFVRFRSFRVGGRQRCLH